MSFGQSAKEKEKKIGEVPTATRNAVLNLKGEAGVL
jgi:hypothetical protein